MYRTFAGDPESTLGRSFASARPNGSMDGTCGLCAEPHLFRVAVRLPNPLGYKESDNILANGEPQISSPRVPG